MTKLRKNWLALLLPALLAAVTASAGDLKVDGDVSASMGATFRMDGRIYAAVPGHQYLLNRENRILRDDKALVTGSAQASMLRDLVIVELPEEKSDAPALAKGDKKLGTRFTLTVEVTPGDSGRGVYVGSGELFGIAAGVRTLADGRKVNEGIRLDNLIRHEFIPIDEAKRLTDLARLRKLESDLAALLADLAAGRDAAADGKTCPVISAQCPAMSAYLRKVQEKIQFLKTNPPLQSQSEKKQK